MRYGINILPTDIDPENNSITIDGEFDIKNICLIVDETNTTCICSSMLKDNIIDRSFVNGRTTFTFDSKFTLNPNNLYTFLVDDFKGTSSIINRITQYENYWSLKYGETNDLILLANYNYTRISYLKNTGLQYIDTDIPLSLDLDIVVGFTISSKNNNTGELQYYFGAANSSLNIRKCVGIASNSLTVYYNGIMSGSNYYSNTSDIYLTGVTFRLDDNCNVFRGSGLNNDITSLTKIITHEKPDYEDVDASNNIILFGCSKNGVIDICEGFEISIYYVDVFRDNIQLCRMVPCVNNLGKPCMYDLIRLRAFYNQGSGELIPGPIIKLKT